MNSRLPELARVFLKLGMISFGGPAAHIAMMRKEFVERRLWLTDGRFLDLIGITNLIPGPNSRPAYTVLFQSQTKGRKSMHIGIIIETKEIEKARNAFRFAVTMIGV